MKRGEGGCRHLSFTRYTLHYVCYYALNGKNERESERAATVAGYSTSSRSMSSARPQRRKEGGFRGKASCGGLVTLKEEEEEETGSLHSFRLSGMAHKKRQFTKHTWSSRLLHRETIRKAPVSNDKRRAPSSMPKDFAILVVAKSSPKLLLYRT